MANLEAKELEQVIPRQNPPAQKLNTLIDTFVEEQGAQYKSGCFTNTNVSPYDSLTGLMILTHAKSTPFFRHTNRPRLSLEKMKVLDENGILLKPEFETAINNRKKA